MTKADGSCMVERLLQASHLAAFDELPGLVRSHARAAGLADARIYVADVREDVLREVTGEGLAAVDGGEELRIDATLAGRAFQDIHTQHRTTDGSRRHWLPLLDGTERLGVLACTAENDADEDTLARMRGLSSAVGLLVASKRGHSDSYARLIRTQLMTVSAEMQWALMPPRTMASRAVTIAAVMEPAYETAGDAYDYALAGQVAHLAVFDAMGHDTTAGLTANLAMATCRNRRRQQADLNQVRDAVESTLIEQFARDNYVTAILADLDLRTGLLRWLNCGHPPPLLIREGRWVTALDGPPTHPLGTDLGLPATVHREQLQPGDRLLLYTDGITEAQDRHGRQFGVDRFVDFINRRQSDGLPVPETLRRLTREVLGHNEGRLQDDATVVLCEWHGLTWQPEDRTSRA
ncbi:PP2C family protein-serine/threonine phosphatase [Streptomyces sp. NPDC057426]